MARIPPQLFILFLLLTTLPLSTSIISYTFPYTTAARHIQTLISYAHSLTTRIANLRASRGDIAGANRAKLIADKLHRIQGIGLWKLVWSVGWDYARNYAWTGLSYGELYGAVKDVNELLSGIAELTRLRSDAERVAWVGRNYGSLLRLSKSMFDRLLHVFQKSGALRELVETVRREVVEGDLLRGCLEVGSNDLKGLLQIFKDFALQFSGNAQDNYNRNEL